MTTTPADLLGHRSRVMAKTGLRAVEVGIPGDDEHATTGGYHIGKDGLVRIGRFHPPPTSRVGSSTEDYSARQLRDRVGLTNAASAVDYGDDWPRGGRQAWIRFNNLLYEEMRDRPGNLPALRAINFSRDGRERKRYDQNNRSQGVINSTDTVTNHSHAEFWRDTEGTPARAQTLARIEQLIDAAIGGTAPPPASGPQEEDEGMLPYLAQAGNQYYRVQDGWSHPLSGLGTVAWMVKTGVERFQSGNRDPKEWRKEVFFGDTELWIRQGWNADMGTVPTTAAAVAAATTAAVVASVQALEIDLDDAELEALADKVQEGVPILTTADIVDAVKQAQREGTGDAAQ